ncbi:MAG: DUF2799 domain-containing protein [Pseudomonadota bacterium]
MVLRLRFFWAFGFVGLVACGPIDSVSPEQCQAGDWSNIGFADGKAGRSEAYVSRHQEACAKVGITPDTTAWIAGRTRGLQQYCTPQNAYSIGRDGTELSNVCSGSVVTELNRANAKGLKYHALGREISSLRTRSSDIDTKLFFLGTPQTEEQAQERRQLLREQEKIKTRISDLELQRIDYSVL